MSRLKSWQLHATTPARYRGGSTLVGGLTLLWAVGVLIGLARIALGWTGLAAIFRSARALDLLRHGSTLERVRNALGVAALPPVVTSARVRAPVAAGLWRPWVILPEGLAESLASDSLRDVLIHECAHVVRLDAWVGLLQRLAGTLFWPHPLVHYASGQLTRAREEVCDNYVLQCGSPRDYARTLLALTEQCLPLGAVGPGLGLLGTRWTLADRVTGLLDARRIPMTRTTFRLKIAVWVLLAVAALVVATIRVDRTARADEPQPSHPTRAPRLLPVSGVSWERWSMNGVSQLPARSVRAVPDDGAIDGPKTGPDGAFALALGGRRLYIMGIVAETDGGERIGLVRFE